MAAMLAAILFKLVTSVRSTAVSETKGKLEDFGDDKKAFHQPYKLQYKRRLVLSFRRILVGKE